MKKFALFFVLTALLVSSCASTRFNQDRFDEKVYNKGGKAYILLGAKNNLGALKGAFPVDNLFVFENNKGEKVSFYIRDGETLSFLVNPGDYKLVSYELNGAKDGGYWLIGNVIYAFKKKDRLFNDLIVEHGGRYSFRIELDFSKVVRGNFSVKEGDVVYLGCVDTTITDVKRSGAHKIMSFRPEVGKHVMYETDIKNLFETINKTKFEQEAKKEIRVNLLQWQHFGQGDVSLDQKIK